jgi:predicted nucleotidyltransferase
MGRTVKLDSEHLQTPAAAATGTLFFTIRPLPLTRYPMTEIVEPKPQFRLPCGKSRVRHLEEKPRLRYVNWMKRAEAITRLRDHEAELKRLGVQHLYLFGSTARDEARDESDVDLFFDYEKGKLGVFELMDVKEAAARILGRRTDIMTRDSIHKLLRQGIEATAVPVF